MAASFRAELLKLRKRPAVWVLALVWVAVVVLFGYFFAYSFLANAPPPPDDLPPEVRAQEKAFNEAQLEALLPGSLLENLLAGTPFGFGTAMALVLGALTAGSEYGWGTVKTALTQRPGRSGVLFGKLLALAAALLALVLLGFAAGALSAFVVSRLEGAATDWPSAWALVRGLGVGFLLFSVYGSLGFALATLFRGTALAIGLGLAWTAIIETAISALPIESDAFEAFRKATLGESTLGASGAFGSPFPEEFGIPEPLVEPERAVLTLIAYALVFLLFSLFFFRRRDVA